MPGNYSQEDITNSLDDILNFMQETEKKFNALTANISQILVAIRDIDKTAEVKLIKEQILELQDLLDGCSQFKTTDEILKKLKELIELEGLIKSNIHNTKLLKKSVEILKNAIEALQTPETVGTYVIVFFQDIDIGDFLINYKIPPSGKTILYQKIQDLEKKSLIGIKFIIIDPAKFIMYQTIYKQEEYGRKERVRTFEAKTLELDFEGFVNFIIKTTNAFPGYINC